MDHLLARIAAASLLLLLPLQSQANTTLYGYQGKWYSSIGSASAAGCAVQTEQRQQAYCTPYNLTVTTTCGEPGLGNNGGTWGSLFTWSCGAYPYAGVYDYSYGGDVLQCTAGVNCPAIEDEQTDCSLLDGSTFTLKRDSLSGGTICESGAGCVAVSAPKTGGVISGLCLGAECTETFRYTSQACTTEPPGGYLPETGSETCLNSPALEYCVSNSYSAGADCGYVNGDWTCLTSTPTGGCQDAAGGVLCDASAGSPPAPDNGTRSQPAQPDGTLNATRGDQSGNTTGTNEYHFYNGTTVAGSQGGVQSGPATGRDTNGDGTTGGCETDGSCSEESTGTASGGTSCDSPPVCEGDPIACLTLKQQWDTRCALEGEITPSDVATILEGLDSGVSEGWGEEGGPVVEVQELGGEGILGDASCPSPLNITVMGRSLSLNIWQGGCQMADWFRPFVLLMGYLIGAFIFIKGGI